MKYSTRGCPRKLTPEQELKIREIVTKNEPIQLRLKHAFWTSEALQFYIGRDWNITISTRTASKYLNEWGRSPHRRERAYEFEECLTAEWYKNNLSKIPGADTLDPLTLERVIMQKARLEVAKKRNDIAVAEKEAAKIRNSHKKRSRTRQAKC